MSGIDPRHLLEYVIRPSLQALGPRYSTPAAQRLLLATAAQESHCGRYLHQIKGPAKGVFQIEPATLHDLYTHYLAFREHPLPAEDAERVVYDLRYATQVARMQYYRHPEALPAPEDVDGLWRYYRRYWNSRLGGTTYAEFITSWERFVAPVYA